jgi:hypothetical protein
MDITVIDGSFAVSMLRNAKYAWNKDGSLVLKDIKTPLNVTTFRGTFVELVNSKGDVLQEGGDGEWLWLPESKVTVTLRHKALADPKLSKAQIAKVRRKTTVHVVNQECYDGGPINFGASYTDGTLLKVIASFQKVLTSIPKEYRKKARCQIDSESGYEGSHYASVRIEYTRPENDDEVVERVKIERERERLAKRAKQAQFEQLKSELETAS